MRFFQQLYEQSQGGPWWAIGSLLLFLLFFGAMVYFVLGMRQSFVNDMKHLPFEGDDGQFDNTEKTVNHE